MGADNANKKLSPKQLIGIILVGFLAPIIGIILLVKLVGSINDSRVDMSSPAMSAEAVAARIKPVGEVKVVDANAPVVERSGEAVFTAVCIACHASGALNAPKVGDTAAWSKRIAAGYDMLVKNAINGVRQMPAKGGNPDLTDNEVARAVVYMANKSGAHFTEPKAAAVAPAVPSTNSADKPAT